MKTTQQSDATGTPKNDSNGSTDLPKVIVAPELLAEGAAAGNPKDEKSEGTPITPAEGTATDTSAAGAAAGPVTDTGAATGAANGSSVRDTLVDTQPPAAQTAGADAGADTGKDDEDKLPVNDGKALKYGLIVAAVLGTIALFGIAFVVARNTANGNSPAVTVPATTTSPGAPMPTLPEVRTPAPRLIDATGCRRGQYRVEGNQLVFTNCATVELAEPPAR